MGNCRSKNKTPTNPTTSAAVAATPFPKKDIVDEKSSSTAFLIKSILPIVFPIVRHVASQQLIKDKMILRDEELLEEVDEKNLPLGPIDFSLDYINVVDYETLCKDQECMPEFAWPEQERVVKMKEKKEKKESSTSSPSSPLKNNSTEADEEFLVLDVHGFVVRLNLEPGIEFVVPVEGPLGVKVNVEIGAGGAVKHPWVQVGIPKLRIWYVNETRMAYVAFLERPSLLPHLHVNADRGKGDFFEIEFSGDGGGFDDVVESILCGFGPSSVTHPEEHKNAKEKPNWVADALGRRISKMMSRFADTGGDRPLEIDLNESFQSAIDGALGKPRPVEAIKADITTLEAELKLAEEAEEAAKNKTKSSPTTDGKRDESDNNTMVVGGDGDKDKNTNSSALRWCGIGV